MIALDGFGLHGGKPARVTLQKRPGVVTVEANGHSARVRDLGVASTERATTVAFGGLRVQTIEHLFAALGGMSIHEGVHVTLEGEEMPLLDGSAARFCEALASLEIGPAPPALTIVREAVIDVNGSRYELEPADETLLRVRVEFGDARVAPDASWSGDASDFRERIAPARTFAFAHEIPSLLEDGLASHVSPESVIVLAPGRVYTAGKPYARDEPARHKLLDLMGDLYLYGGPPRGRVTAFRPGHGATHTAMKRALEAGAIAIAS